MPFILLQVPPPSSRVNPYPPNSSIKGSVRKPLVRIPALGFSQLSLALAGLIARVAASGAAAPGCALGVELGWLVASGCATLAVTSGVLAAAGAAASVAAT